MDNAAVKGSFTDVGRGFFRVFGQSKVTLLLGFTIAGYDLDRIRSYRAEKRAGAEAKPASRSGAGGPGRTW
jgi:hypothetical protein